MTLFLREAGSEALGHAADVRGTYVDVGCRPTAPVASWAIVEGLFLHYVARHVQTDLLSIPANSQSHTDEPHRSI